MNDKKIQNTFAKMLEDLINKLKGKENDTGIKPLQADIFPNGNTGGNGIVESFTKFHKLESSNNKDGGGITSTTYQGSISESSGKIDITKTNGGEQTKGSLTNTIVKLQETFATIEEVTKAYLGNLPQEEKDLHNKLKVYKKDTLESNTLDSNKTTPSKTKAKNSKDPKTNNDRGGR